VVVPWSMHPVIKLYQLFPGLLEWGIAKRLQRGGQTQRSTVDEEL